MKLPDRQLQPWFAQKAWSESMKAALKSRMQIQYPVLLGASVLALFLCLSARPVACIASDASPATAKESSEKKDKAAETDSKKEKPESAAKHSTNGKSEHKEAAKSSTTSADS